jgi:hypothetical protein
MAGNLGNKGSSLNDLLLILLTAVQIALLSLESTIGDACYVTELIR